MGLQEQLESLFSKLQPKINRAMEREVLDAVRTEEVKAIEETVYDAYEPIMYRRRGEYGGMADPENIEGEVDEDGNLHVYNRTEANSKYAHLAKYKNLPLLVETGHGGPGGRYDYPKFGAGFMKPRRFTERTIERLAQSGKHIDALEDGLNRLGIRTK